MKEIPLSKGFVAQVSDKDFKELNKHKWCARYSGKHLYAMRRIRVDGRDKYIYMHRQLLGITDPNIKGEHKDGNGLNNQRSNLRTATHAQNCWNTSSKGGSSRFKGVHWTKWGWNAQIAANRIRYSLGHYEKEEDAAKAYNKKALELHGKFVRLNKIDVQKLSEKETT